MADTRKTWSELDTLFADNTAGAISPQDLRDGFAALEPNTSTSAPGASDDGTDGYDTGHAWLKLDGSGDPEALYKCLANDTGAAVWKQVWPPLVDDLDLSGTDVADLSSGEATDGQVATADGSGGVAWEDPASGMAGPASSVDGNLAAFDGTGGGTLKDSGKAASDFATAAQGTLAGTATQPGDDADTLGSGDATDGQVLTADGSGGAAWEDAASAATTVSINAQTGTTYTLVLTDAGKLVTLTNGSATTLTVPTSTSVAFEVGAVIALAQLGAGLVTVAGDTGVTVNSLDSNLDLAGQYATASLTKTAADTWLLSGGLA